MIFIVTFGCIISILILMKLMYNMKHRRFYQLLKQFPSYTTYPLIGNIDLFFCSSDDLLMKAEKIFLPFDRLLFWVGPQPVLALRKYDDVMTVLNQSQEREIYHMADEWTHIGLITASYKEWKKSRKLLNPAFTTDMLSKYVEVFNKNALNLVKNIKSIADIGEDADVLDHVLNANLHTIVENTMGVSMESSGKHGIEFCKAIIEGFSSILKRCLSPWLHPHFIYTLYLKMTGKIEYVKIAQNFSSKIVEHKMNNMHNRNIQLDNADSSKTIIDLLVKKSVTELGFDETRIRDELLQIIIAGMETTAVNVSFLMLMLAIHQDVQQKVYEEIIQTMGGNNYITSDQAFHQLKYLEQCIRETIRMYAPVAETTRRTHKECVLKGNVTIPANLIVLTVLHFTHRDPELFKNPDEWDPEHFSKQAIDERPKGSTQLSFGFGPRSCIGAKYAMMSVKIQISHILLNYHLSTQIKEVRKDDLSMDLMIRSKIGYPVTFTSRKKVEIVK